MYEFVCSCLYSIYVPQISGDQKRLSNLMKLELQMVVCHHVGAGGLTQVFWKSSGCSFPLGYLSSPKLRHLKTWSRVMYWPLLDTRCGVLILLPPPSDSCHPPKNKNKQTHTKKNYERSFQKKEKKKWILDKQVTMSFPESSWINKSIRCVWVCWLEPKKLGELDTALAMSVQGKF